jgi:hypothetical protein
LFLHWFPLIFFLLRFFFFKGAGGKMKMNRLGKRSAAGLQKSRSFVLESRAKCA